MCGAGPRADVSQNATVMHSFHSLFCNRCLNYECIFHSASAEPRNPGSAVEEVDSKSCGAGCYIDFLNDIRCIDGGKTDAVDAMKPVCSSGQLMRKYVSELKEGEYRDPTVDTAEEVKCSACTMHIQDGWECSCKSCTEHNALCSKCALLNPDSLFMTQHRAHIFDADGDSFDEKWKRLRADQRWTKVEVALLKRACVMFGDHYCQISAFLGTKTCLQVQLLADAFPAHFCLFRRYNACTAGLLINR